MKHLRSWMVLALAVVALVVFAMPALAADETAKGKIKSVQADKNTFVLTDAKAKDWTFEMSATSKVKLADKDGKLADLKAGDEVTVTYEKKGEKLICSAIERK